MQKNEKKYFNPNKKIDYQKHELEICPTLISSVNIIKNNIFVKIDLSFKVVRRVTVLQHFINSVKVCDKDEVID